ncbi:MAG: hypothetical protein ACP5IA_09560, partial [Sediminispirochaetaceae bacterium]
IFCNGGNEEVFLSSADLMPRNIDRRVEVTCPVFDQQLQKEIRDLFDIEWADTVKARILDQELNNEYRPDHGNTRCRSQLAKRTYLAEKHKVEKAAGRDENVQVS